MPWISHIILLHSDVWKCCKSMDMCYTHVYTHAHTQVYTHRRRRLSLEGPRPPFSETPEATFVLL